MANTLPGANVPGGTLPHTTQVGPVPDVPPSWVDRARIIATVLALWEKDPVAANSLHEWAKAKLASMGNPNP